jgi:hypothetical protein
MFQVFTVHDRPGSGVQPKTCPQYYVRRVRVDTELPLRFGIDVWGYPKQLGTTVYDAETDPNRVTFSYAEPGQDASFSGSCARDGFAPYPGNPPFEFVTPYAIRRSYAAVINAPKVGANPGSCQWKVYNAATDRFVPGPTTSLGKELRDLDFKAKTWFLCERMEAVGFLADVGPAVVQATAPQPVATAPAASTKAAKRPAPLPAPRLNRSRAKQARQ